MTKTKQQIQDEIAELQKQLEEIDNLEMKDIFFWGLELGYSCNLPFNYINGLFMVRKTVKHSSMPSHGLGKFETREEAERAKAALVFILERGYQVNKNTLQYILQQNKELFIFNRKDGGWTLND